MKQLTEITVKFLHRIKDEAISILFPLYCVGCGKEGSWCCEECATLLANQAVLRCPVCFKTTVAGRTCEECKKYSSLDGLVAAASYADPAIRGLIKALKFARARETLPFLARASVHSRGIIAATLRDALIVAVPLHPARSRMRGYNQAELIAKNLFPDLIYESEALTRVRNTIPQSDLNSEKRLSNPKGAFRAMRSFSGRTILLVDDVYTTGATMEACAKALKEAGAQSVWGFAVARG